MTVREAKLDSVVDDLSSQCEARYMQAKPVLLADSSKKTIVPIFYSIISHLHFNTF